MSTSSQLVPVPAGSEIMLHFVRLPHVVANCYDNASEVLELGITLVGVSRGDARASSLEPDQLPELPADELMPLKLASKLERLRIRGAHVDHINFLQVIPHTAALLTSLLPEAASSAQADPEALICRGAAWCRG